MNDFQRSFFARLKKKDIPRSEMVTTIGELLHVGRDAVYRRMRGDTVLSADELMILAAHYNVELLPDQKKEAGLPPIMTYPSGLRGVGNSLEYFQLLRMLTHQMVYLPNISIDYATPELPIYYELSLPVLRSFKVFMYTFTTWTSDSLRDTAFAPELIAPEIHELAEEMLTDAYRMRGRELWSIGILDVTLRQIEYVAQIGRFARKETIGLLFEEVHRVVDHLELMVRTGKRFPIGEQPTEDSPEFRVYHNELTNTNSIIVVNSETENYVFSTLVNPNYLLGSDPRIVEDVQRWFNNLLKSSNALSSEFPKYAGQYFRRLRMQVDKTWERIKFGSMNF
ncbi:MAG: hypothetical protein AAFN92_02410 [Bacteroidota bacterium]